MSTPASADLSRLAEALRKTAEASEITTHDVLVQSANHIQTEMIARAPVKSGHLRNNIVVKVETGKVTIGPDPERVPYHYYVSAGTKPHTIYPKKEGGVLVFTVNGQKVFTRKVNHPGTKPNHYIRDSFNAWVDSLGTIAAEANVQRLTDEVNNV